jgi:3-hydroxyisobutyrate dehydrogenase-like beta-hydroxyacid dehydrogenase
MSESMRAGFIGLGVMGYPMAGHLVRSGVRLRVHNRSVAKGERWATEFAGTVASSPAEAARDASVVFLCVRNDRDVEEVVTGSSGVLRTLAPGGVIVDHTTTSLAIARGMAQAAREHGVCFLDAPVSGGEVGAMQGTLTVMAGGDHAAFDAVSPLFAAYAKKYTWFGDSGNGQLCKMVNQILLAGLIQALSEGTAFAKRVGLDMDALVDTLRCGAAQSWQLEHRARTMAQGRFDFGFAVELMCKDLGIVAEQAQRVGAVIPVTEIVRGYYEELARDGAGRLDTSALIQRLLP